MQKQEASQSPIHPRREIVPGVYGRIKVTGTYGVKVAGTYVGRVTMEWAAAPIVGLSANELREAAHLFNQIAEVLEENAG